MFTSEVIYSNCVFLLSRYAFFIEHFFRNKYIKFIIKLLKYITYGYAFYLLKGYAGCVLCAYLFLEIIIFKIKLNKSLFVKLLLTILLIMIIYLTSDYKNIFLLTPYIFILLRMWLINNLLSNGNKYKRTYNFFMILSYVLLSIYTWNIKAYVLFMIYVSTVCFNLSGLFIKKMVKTINDNII